MQAWGHSSFQHLTPGWKPQTHSSRYMKQALESNILERTLERIVRDRPLRQSVLSAEDIIPVVVLSAMASANIEEGVVLT